MRPPRAHADSALLSTPVLRCATIIYLEDRKTPCGAHCFSEPMETGHVSLMCRPYSLPGAPALFDVSGGRNRGSESAGSTSSDKFEFVFGNRPIFMGRIGRQRSNRKPICHLLSAVELERKPNNHRLNLRSSQAGQRRMEARPLQGGPFHSKKEILRNGHWLAGDAVLIAPVSSQIPC